MTNGTQQSIKRRGLTECPKCEGAGEWDEPHPHWGSRTCPEAYVQVICDECDGSGVVPFDVREEWLEAKL